MRAGARGAAYQTTHAVEPPKNACLAATSPLALADDLHFERLHLPGEGPPDVLLEHRAIHGREVMRTQGVTRSKAYDIAIGASPGRKLMDLSKRASRRANAPR